MLSAPLTTALSEFDDCSMDFERAGFRNAPDALARMLDCLQREPLSSLMLSLLPEVDFKTWWQGCLATNTGVGAGRMNWPSDRAVRVAMQLALCRSIACRELELNQVALDFCYTGSTRFDDNLVTFADRVVRPLVRDFSKLAELRVSPPVLAESLAQPLPGTGDSILDQLVAAARDGFRDKSAASRRQAWERLWDAWERLKSVELSENKRLSATILLNKAAVEPAFRAVLEAEAKALNSIGNEFQIRHFETDTTALTADRQVDYLFHRMWALLWLLLTARQGSP